MLRQMFSMQLLNILFLLKDLNLFEVIKLITRLGLGLIHLREHKFNMDIYEHATYIQYEHIFNKS